MRVDIITYFLRGIFLKLQKKKHHIKTYKVLLHHYVTLFCSTVLSTKKLMEATTHARNKHKDERQTVSVHI